MVLFDLDGTLINSENHYVLGTSEWLSNLGISVSFDELCNIIGLTEKETYEYISKVSGLDIDQIKKYNTNYFSKTNPINFKKLLFKDVINCMEYLKSNNIRVGICSMSSKQYIENFIKECSLNAYIDCIISCEECKHQKPNPEIYNKAIELFKVHSDEVLIVEDSTRGIQAAKDSGAFVVARNAKKYGQNQDNALFLFDDLAELNTIIMEINDGKYDSN